MNNNEIATELRKRADEMRALPPGAWADHSPMRGQECAVMGCDDWAMIRMTLSPAAHLRANRWIALHGLASSLAAYNDGYAVDQFDVANVLDKIAEDIS